MQRKLLIILTLMIFQLSCLAQNVSYSFSSKKKAIENTHQATTLSTQSQATTKVVDLPTAGQLKSLISKEEQKNLVKLVIRGNHLNTKDGQFIAKMPALQILDISGVTNLELESVHVSGLIIKMLGMKNVKTLIDTTRDAFGLPMLWDSQDEVPEIFASLPNFTDELLQRIPKNYQIIFPKMERLCLKNGIRRSIPTGFPEKMLIGKLKTDDGSFLKAYLLQDGTILYESKEDNEDAQKITFYDKVYRGQNSYDSEKKIFISKDVKYIARFAASPSCEATEIEFEEGDEPLYIGEEAFAGLDARSIVFNRPVHIEDRAFYKSNPHEVIFNKNVIYLGKRVFSDYPYNRIGVRSLIFKTVPEKLGNPIVEANNYQEVIVPEGTEQEFVSLGILKSRINAAGQKKLSYTIKLHKPNSILSEIPMDKLRQIDSLTIIGVMYETDLAVLQECKNLRYLNLENTIITYSPEKMEQNRNERESSLAFFQLLGLNATMQYNDFKMSSMEYIFTQALVKLAEGSTKVTKAEEGCFIPDNALSNMFHLETVILPAKASRVGENAFAYCTSLEKVKLSPFLEKIENGAFAHCENLEEIDFPSTLKSIGGSMSDGPFSHTKIKKLDFSRCNFDPPYFTFEFLSEEYPWLQEIHFPSCKEDLGFHVYKPMKVFTSTYISRIECHSDNNEIHFKTSTPPERGSIYNSTIYIPKGSATAYFSKFGSTNKYIEE